MNKVTLIGRIAQNLELKKTPNGISVVQFSLAVNRAFQNKNGDKQTDFISCIAWQNQADNLVKYMGKGSQIAVEGRIEVKSYTDQQGNKKYSTDVICEQIHFLSKSERSETKASPNDFMPRESSQPANPFDKNYQQDFSMDDLAF